MLARHLIKTAPYTLRWGIMATGGIAQAFTKDLLTSPSIRGATDVAHVLAAASSSTSYARAANFLTTVDAPATTKAYGSYAELVADPAVDIVYVATPHSHHFQNAMLALKAGKHVLCEKALTVTAAQARKLVATAREKGLFFMEAVWTRFFPISTKVRELVRTGELGDIFRMYADCSLAHDDGAGNFTLPDSHRLLNLNLAGGALLDVGVYSLTWAFQVLYHARPDRQPPSCIASIHKAPTGVDENTTLMLLFPPTYARAMATSNLRVATAHDRDDGPVVRIQGSKGELQIFGTAYRPLRYRFLRYRPILGGGGGDGDPEVEEVDFPIPVDEARGGWGRGMFWEADECARCLRDGKTESEVMPLEESVVMMELMEEALRQNAVEYPDLITSDEFEPKSPLNLGRGV